ncbi:MAG TPA: CorA family divalent cation transporter [Verrucomicrobiae bacterium]|nr:CorA family divalent cation transporter [Verrucomicrobiae bacterium]
MITPPTWSLPEAIRVRLGQSTFGRQRAIVEDGHLLLILNQPPGPDDRDREAALFWRTPKGEWQFSRGGPGPGSLKRFLQSYTDLEASLAQQYDVATDTRSLFELIESLTPLVRSARNLHQALQTARDEIGNDTFLIEMRDQAYALERNLDLLLEDCRNALQYRTARESEVQARLSKQALQASHRLNILAALFFPLTAVASLFGMNLAHGIDDTQVIYFWIVAAVSLVLGFVMKSWVLGKQKDDEKPDKPN